MLSCQYVEVDDTPGFDFYLSYTQMLNSIKTPSGCVISRSITKSSGIPPHDFTDPEPSTLIFAGTRRNSPGVIFRHGVCSKTKLQPDLRGKSTGVSDSQA